jgi:hypothetical protein
MRGTCSTFLFGLLAKGVAKDAKKQELKGVPIKKDRFRKLLDECKAKAINHVAIHQGDRRGPTFAHIALLIEEIDGP